MRFIGKKMPSLSKKSLEWSMVLDPVKWHVKLKRGKIEHPDQVIRQLKLEDMKKFGKINGSSKVEVERKVGQFVICSICNVWLDGVCFKHPLIFIKEKVPTRMPYTVFDTIPEFLYLDISTIPKAGRGIFAKIDLPRGLSFGPYSGFISFLRTSEVSGYSWHLAYPEQESVYVDAIGDSFSNWMRYVNCARFEQEQNVVGWAFNQSIYYYTYKPVPADTELLVWYGVDYGTHLKIPRPDRCLALKAPTKLSYASSVSFSKSSPSAASRVYAKDIVR